MARNPKQTAPQPETPEPTDATVTVRGTLAENVTDSPETAMVTVFGAPVEYNGVTIDVPAFSVPATFAAAIKYLLPYGFNQSMQDCVSGLAKEMKDENAAREDDDEDKLDDTELTAAIKAAVNEEQTKRRDAILSGQVTARGPRLPTIERLVRDKALAYLKAVGKKQGKKLPKRPKDAKKGSPNVALNAMIDSAIASPLGAKWRAEAQKEIDALAAIEVTFDPFAAPATDADKAA